MTYQTARAILQTAAASVPDSIGTRTMVKGSVDARVKALGVSVCFARLTGFQVENKNDKVRTLKREIAAAIKDRWDDRRLASEPRLAGYRDLYDRVGAGAEKIVPSCEGLIRTVKRTGGFPTINSIVDLYCCVSALHLVTMGAHDASRIEGELRVSITTGRERFIPLGSHLESAVRPGEYAYMDDRDILCRLDVKQCNKTKITLATSEVILVANSHEHIPIEDLRSACEHLCEIARRLLGAEAEILAVV